MGASKNLSHRPFDRLRFAERIAPHLGKSTKVSEIPKRQRLLHRPALKMLLAWTELKEARNNPVAQAHIEHGYTLAEISKAVGLHYATLSRIINPNVSHPNGYKNLLEVNSRDDRAGFCLP